MLDHVSDQLPLIMLAAFTTVNLLRIFAYLPQIMRAARDPHGASAVSYCTWGLFLLSNLTTAAYAHVNLRDDVMTTVFLANAVACLVIVLVTFVKRRRYAARTSRLTRVA